MSKIITSPVVPLPDSARDAYEVAAERGVTPEEAARQQAAEGWEFIGYNDCGQAAYVPRLEQATRRPCPVTRP